MYETYEIQIEYCVSYHTNPIRHLMTYTKNQIPALRDPLPSLGDLLGSWFDSGGSWLKSLLFNFINVTGCITYILCHKIIVSCITN